MFLGKEVLKKCGKFTGEHPCRGAILIKLPCNFIEIALQPGCSPVNLLHIFRKSFLKNTSGRLLLKILSVNSVYAFLLKLKRFSQEIIQHVFQIFTTAGSSWFAALYCFISVHIEDKCFAPKVSKLKPENVNRNEGASQIMT